MVCQRKKPKFFREGEYTLPYSAAVLAILRSSHSERKPDNLLSMSPDMSNHIGHLHVGISPAIGSEEANGHIGMANKWTQNPAHLNSDERINKEPQSQHPAMSWISLDQRLILLSQHPLAAKAGDGNIKPLNSVALS